MDENKQTHRKSNERLYCTLLVFAALVITGLVAGIVVLALKLKDPNHEKEHQVCLTEGCTRAAARVLDSIDASEDPCNNFYRFACGGFLKTHVIPDDSANIDVWSIVRDNVQYTCKYLLERPDLDPNATAVQKAKDLYASCVNTGK
ncbi:membrane metallo-endopeptidase-like 1 [Dreissena polymorpha]|uniref:Peptidase M13 N-terminal domain-containing protein n=1 Tax=Dreissena polymorpha TaxID=45954 RepID=A0A9D3Z810_DREPO|nr:membrane metallo-endopeptidase-like 1 [Dreissena polymorpha]KAH3712315.1 hypothetical protein DPMN_072010 [Dreissena polymorpha]